MNYPSDDTMLVLLGIHCGSPVEVPDGLPMLRIEGVGLVPMSTDHLDVLELERGWIEIVGEQPIVTRQGDYWLRKWMEKNWRSRVVANLIR